jgi:hypothetical protein
LVGRVLFSGGGGDSGGIGGTGSLSSRCSLGSGLGPAREQGEGAHLFSVPLPGPHPFSNVELGLAPQAPQRQWTENALEEEIIEGDWQKADDSAVPDHLWLGAFVAGYNDKGCVARHLEALNLVGGDRGFLEGSRPPSGWREALPALCLLRRQNGRRRAPRGQARRVRTHCPARGAGAAW